MFFCPVCQIENRLDAKFCRKCGQSREALEQHAMAVVTKPAAEAVVAVDSGETGHRGVGNSETSRENDFVSEISSAEINLAGDAAAPDFSKPECPACLTALRFTDKFCCWCGEAQPLRNPNLLTCMRCTTILPTRANFCYSCGAQVSNGNRKVRAHEDLFSDEDSEDFPRFHA